MHKSFFKMCCCLNFFCIAIATGEKEPLCCNNDFLLEQWCLPITATIYRCQDLRVEILKNFHKLQLLHEDRIFNVHIHSTFPF